MAKKKKTEETTLQLTKLSPHPLQNLYYEESNPADDDALAADLAANGQREPIEVLPPNNQAGLPANTILDGHRRAQLLAEAGLSEAIVIIRHDLAEADAAAVEAEFLGFNLYRRQLHPLDKARGVLRLYQLEKGLPRDKQMSQSQEQEIRDRIGARIGMSGRNLSRYFRVLLTPIEIQRAVRDRQLPLVMGEKVEGLEKPQQAQIAKRIRQGEPPKEVVEEYLPKPKKKRRTRRTTIGIFLDKMEAALKALDKCNLEEVPRLSILARAEELNRAEKIIKELLGRI